MRWIESSGGPLVALPGRELGAWQGERGQYDAASEITDVGLLRIDGSRGELDVLVLWDEPMATTYSEKLGFVVQWRYGDDEESLLELVAADAESADWEQAAELELDDRLVVFDAADAGDDVGIDDRLEVNWPHGAGFIEVAEVESDQNAAKIIRFRHKCE